MTKVTKLVYTSMVTRVVVDENATEQQIIEASKPNFIEKIVDTAFGEHIEEVIDDEECPYDPNTD